MDLTQNIDHLWLIAGAVMIILEFLAVPGVGFVFAGLGALTTGALLTFGVIPDTIWQWVFFLGFTIAWAVILWKPFKGFRTGKDQKPFSDISGQKAFVTQAINPGKMGMVRWSGTIMNAKAENPEVSHAEGEQVVISHAEGNVLIVK